MHANKILSLILLVPHGLRRKQAQLVTIHSISTFTILGSQYHHYTYRHHCCRITSSMQNPGPNWFGSLYQTGPKLSVLSSVLWTDIQDWALSISTTCLEPSKTAYSSWEKHEKLSFKLGKFNGWFQHLRKLLQLCNVKNHTKPFPSNQSLSFIVEPPCKLYLKSHIIQPDTNQQSQFKILHLSLNWGIKNLFPTSNFILIADELVQLRSQGTHFITAKDLQGLKFDNRKNAQ